jgi:O-antigen/teichoic acid export membrane protein
MDPLPDTNSSARPKPDAAKRLVRGSTLLLVGRLVSKLGNFATQVLIVRALSQSAYGAFAYALVTASLIQNVITLGLDRSIVRFLPIFHEERDYRRLFGTIAMTVMVIVSLGLLAVLGLYGFQGLVGGWVRDQQALGLLLVLVFLAPIQALDDLLVGLFAVFAKPRAIFVRRHVLAPGLKLAVVIGLILSHSSVLFLAVGYLAASLVGVGIYGYQLVRLLRDQGLLAHASFRELVMPWRQIFGFSIPLLTSDLVYVTMNAINVLLLGHFWGTTGVANLRAVQPTATMNEMVMASFATLFTPLAARLFANDDRVGINGLYWRTAIWIAIFTFPMFAVTFCLARPITLLLFGARYEDAAPILALLSFGSYFNAALGFNGLTLKVFGRVRYLVLMNIATVVVSVSASALLIPRWGALGAGIATMIALIVHNLFKQAGLKLGTGIHLFEWRYLRVYLVIALCTAGLLAIQLATSPPVPLGLGLAALAALVVLLSNRRMLEVDQMFPEARRLPVLGWLASGRRGTRGLPDLNPGRHPEPDPATRP